MHLKSAQFLSEDCSRAFCIYMHRCDAAYVGDWLMVLCNASTARKIFGRNEINISRLFVSISFMMVVVGGDVVSNIILLVCTHTTYNCTTRVKDNFLLSANASRTYYLGSLTASTYIWCYATRKSVIISSLPSSSLRSIEQAICSARCSCGGLSLRIVSMGLLILLHIFYRSATNTANDSMKVLLPADY